jgi:phosphocarrier protein FPr/phosphocarrier protein
MTDGALRLMLRAPFDGVAMPLGDVPDPVFSQRMMGDGVAIEPLSDTVLAPCDGIVTSLHAARHAVTLRTDAGAEILIHVGLETVALNGDGFTGLVREGQRVTTGTPLIALALDRIALAAPSLATPVVIMDGVPCSIVERAEGKIRAGDPLLTLEMTGAPQAPAELGGTDDRHSRTVAIPMPHGIHARPAARISTALKPFSARVTLHNGERSADGRSTVALLALGARMGDLVRIDAEGPDAAAAVNAVADLVSGGMGETGSAAEPPSPAQTIPAAVEQRSGALRGVRASSGIAIGIAHRFAQDEAPLDEKGGAVAEELACLADALSMTRAQIATRAVQGSDAQRAILTAHLALLDDPALLEGAEQLIRAGSSAAHAWHRVLGEQAAALTRLDDPRLRERAADLKDLDRQVRRALSGRADRLGHLPENAILIADDILPSQLIELDLSRVAGFCLEQGGPTSHVAILAAGMGLPSLVAMGPGLRAIEDGRTLILDADAGWLEVDPSDERRIEVADLIAVRQQRRAAALRDADTACTTADGRRIEIFANLGSVADAEQAARQGAEGAGLVRTEFLFLDRQHAPDDEEQRAIYQTIADALPGRPIIARLLDIGGDKPVPYLAATREDNPMLGVRGIRLALRHGDILEAQLRAMLAVRPAGRLRIMIPMVSDIDEIRQVRAITDRLAAAAALDQPPQLGIMIETPAAAATADLLAAEADFLSIGTNDLTQYVLAIDRGNGALADRVDPLHPAVLRMIKATCDGAARHGRPVGVCGGAAGDAQAVPLLIGLGVTELSMVPGLIPEMKARVRALSMAAARALAEQALGHADAQAVRALARDFARERHP